jgi:integrase
MIGAEEAANLTEVPNIPQKGTRLGNWLTREQAKELLAVPDRSTLKGKRDYVILAILVGCALRREELALLDVDTIQLREGRWVLADLEGKGRRVRTVAIPVWVKQGINSWMTAAGVEDGRLLRAISKGGKVKERMLCRKSGGHLEQIKFLLGHSSIQTTERYLGSEQELVAAVNDTLGL